VARPLAPGPRLPARRRAAGATPAAAPTASELGYLPPADAPLRVALAKVRAVLFFAWTLATAVPLFVVMLAIFPVVRLTDRYQRTGEHLVNNVWAVLSTLPFFPVEIRGRENLPPKSQPVMFVANHQSFMDIYSLFHLWRFFKFVSKTSNFLIPIIGWSMFLTGHIGLKRTDKRSQIAVLKECRMMLQQGCSLLFFPEGTRSKTGRMRTFKKGAFSIAAKEKVPVVPITIDGAGPIMPNQREGEMWPGRVVLTIHPPLLGGTDQELCDAAQQLIASGLPERLRPDPDTEDELTDLD